MWHRKTSRKCALTLKINFLEAFSVKYTIITEYRLLPFSKEQNYSLYLETICSVGRSGAACGSNISFNVQQLRSVSVSLQVKRQLSAELTL